MLSRFFIAGLLAFLLLGAGHGVSQAARYIPWDCSDWQAFAHADRATSILESLAENRGKTLYCGIDQSDTFGKAETWAAGRDHNERDSTEYQGENGRFRGFIAAQEGWLTEGESGITGQSIAIIFEFPREEKRRTKKVKRLNLPADPSRLVPGAPGPTVTNNNGGRSQTELSAQFLYNQTPPTNDWAQLTPVEALRECRSRGYSRVRDAVPVGAESFAYTPDESGDNNPNTWRFAAYKVRQYTATCLKTVRRSR